MQDAREYPFSAVVGQDDFKLALLANAVDPRIGGVLASGDRGTAKSTLARSFAALLRDDEGYVPFVELPLGATLDRLTGALDTEKLLAGEGADLRPGLLADADGGVLYVDEVNLLGDHLVDVMLDAAAFGRVRVERDGVSAQHSARFVLVGTMNPEEGALRPQLLDRFGLSVAIASPETSAERAEIVGRRLAFEQHPDAFHERFAGTEQALREIVERARAAASAVDLPTAAIEQIAELCRIVGAQGMRADIVIARTAVALAALDDRSEVIDRDIETAARLALPHRCADETAGSQQQVSREQIDEALAQARGEAPEGGVQEPSPQRSAPRTSAARVGQSAGEREASVESAGKGSGPIGRGARAEGTGQPQVDAVPTNSTEDLDVIATARAAVTRRIFAARKQAQETGEESPADAVMRSAPGEITAADLRQPVRSGREANLVLCVVDASSSVLENGRGGELRALLAGLVSDARRKRDRVGLIVFRGREARLVAPPSRNHAAVLAGLDTVEPGGTTPLAAGIRVAHETAQRELRRNPELRPIVALVTDGYANIGSTKEGDALAEARTAARELRKDGVTLVVIGETLSEAPKFARATGAEFYPFDPSQGARDAA